MRARNIKPAFFKNEDIGLLDPLARILYIGLWCYCDRAGRFEWRPIRIRVEILPYDDCDIDALLIILIKANEIKKYQVENNMYGFIPTFLKHQNPHNREADSVYPAFEEKHNLGTAQAQPRHGRARLNPESLILNPERGILNQEEKHNLGTAQAQPRHGFLKIGYEWYKDFWNLQANTLSSIRGLTKERRAKLKTRIENNKNFKTDFKQCILKIQQTPFLLGENDRKWRIDFDWLIDNDTKILKILEGKYGINNIETQKEKEMREHEEYMKKYRKGPQYED